MVREFILSKGRTVIPSNAEESPHIEEIIGDISGRNSVALHGHTV